MRHRIMAVVLAAGCLAPVGAAAQVGAKPSAATLALRRAATGITEVRIRTGGTCHRMPERERPVVVLRGADARALVDMIRVNVNARLRGLSCGCCGSHTLEFRAGKRLVAAISVHHWSSLRWREGPWNGDAFLDRRSARQLKHLIRRYDPGD